MERERSARGAGSAFARAVHFGAAFWRPQRVTLSPQQVGAYGDVYLTRRWVQQSPLQRNSSLGLSTGWFVPPNGSMPYWLATKRPGHWAGVQRPGGQNRSGSLTPWTAAQMQGQLVKAQLAQSGLAAAHFTQALIAANLEAA